MAKILIVEDNEENWDVLSRRLKRRGFDVVMSGGEAPSPFGIQQLSPPPPVVGRPTVAARWGSVVLTSLCFAAVHVQPGPGPLWMMPPIFFVAVCLGYAYERTGNLWTTITMHALFNATNTLLFFKMSQS